MSIGISSASLSLSPSALQSIKSSRTLKSKKLLFHYIAFDSPISRATQTTLHCSKNKRNPPLRLNIRSSAAFFFLSMVSLSIANPVPGDSGPNARVGVSLYCVKPPTSDETITNKEGVDGQAVVGVASCKPQAGEECTLFHTINYTVSKSVSVSVTPFSQNGKVSVIG